MFTEFQVMKSEYLHFKYFCWITAFISFLQAHRLVIVDGDNRLEGIVSLSDILNYLVCEDRHYSGSFSNGSCSGMWHILHDTGL